MEIAGDDSFRIRSYRNGATAVEGYPERIIDILRNPERKVTDIPGIGKGLAVVLQEIITRASCERRDELLQKFPPTALEFLKIQGLGPKSIALSSSIFISPLSTNWNVSALIKSCAIFRAWARSWKRRYCAPSRNIASGAGAICSVTRKTWPAN